MSIEIMHYPSNFTLNDLQTTVKTDEKNIRGQLQSIKAAKDTDNVDVTEAKYDTSKKTKLGELTIIISGGASGLQVFKGTAFINKKVENVAVFR
jgi:predicted transcriptional regulator with HTH domain